MGVPLLGVRRGKAALISVAVALPLIVVELVLLADINGAIDALSYGLFVPVGIGFVAYAGCFAVLESLIRRYFLDGWRRWPWLSPVIAAALISFWMVGHWVTPLVLLNPSWCRVTQRVDWSASSGERFILVLIGRGNAADHRFVSAHLNWTGKEKAEISTIEFNPLTFGWWEGYDKIRVDGDQVNLRQRLSASGLPADELDQQAASVLHVLDLANARLEIAAPSGRVDAMDEYPFGNEEVVLGGVVWMASVVIVLLAVGQTTLVVRRHK